MKKILLGISLLLILVGCSNSQTISIKDADEVIYSADKLTYTKKDLFGDMRKNDYSSKVISSILNQTAQLDGIDLSSTEEELSEGYDYYVEMLGQDQVTYYFGTKENYINSYRTSEIISEYFKKEILDDYDTFVEEYKPYKAEIIYFDDEASADATIEAYNAKENTFAYAASENGYASEIKAQIYTDKSDLPVDVKAFVLSAEGPLCSKVITSVVQTDSNGASLSKERFYVVNIISVDTEEIKDEFIEYLTSTYLDTAATVAKVLNDHNVKFYDQTTYDLIKENYPGIN